MMTNLPDALAIVAVGSAILGSGWKAVAKLTRIADSVDRLSEAMEHVVTKINDHENRITRLEERPGTRATRQPRRPQAS